MGDVLIGDDPNIIALYKAIENWQNRANTGTMARTPETTVTLEKYLQDLGFSISAPR